MTALGLARRAMKFYPGATRKARCVQAARYARAIVMLGDKWLLAKRIERRAR
jgi:hypothetical protein